MRICFSIGSVLLFSVEYSLRWFRSTLVGCINWIGVELRQRIDFRWGGDHCFAIFGKGDFVFIKHNFVFIFRITEFTSIAYHIYFNFLTCNLGFTTTSMFNDCKVVSTWFKCIQSIFTNISSHPSISVVYTMLNMIMGRFPFHIWWWMVLVCIVQYNSLLNWNSWFRFFFFLLSFP